MLGGGNKCNRSQPRGPTTSQGASNTAGPKKRELNYPTVISSGVPPPPPHDTCLQAWPPPLGCADPPCPGVFEGFWTMALVT